MKYKLPQPKIDFDKQQLSKILFDYQKELVKVHKKTSHPYLPWKKFELKYQNNYFSIDKQISQTTADTFWRGLSIIRSLDANQTPVAVVNQSEEFFYWKKTNYFDRVLNKFDMKVGGVIYNTKIPNKQDQQFFIRQNLIEEAITSSQLEGAAVTRSVAKQLLNQKRKPRNKHERMIFNNYQAILKIEQEVKDYPLSKKVLLNLHQILTDGTIDQEQVGRWRTDQDKIVIQTELRGETVILHQPPQQKDLMKEIDKLIEYANDLDQDQFIHPLIKAIILHFWVAYIHPFCDGNGRLARAIFFWYLLKKEYYLISYLPFSKLIKNSAAKYRDSFLFTEQYGNDLNYFIDYNLSKINLAIDDFVEYVDQVKLKRDNLTNLLPELDFNDRQKQALSFLASDNQRITTQQHADFHQISWLTASKDLGQLVSFGLLDRHKKGRQVFHQASQKLKSLI